MKFINYDIHATKEQVLDSLKENDKIVEQEKFDQSKGKPKIHIKEKGSDKIKIKCEYIGTQTKDNAFLEGTYFIGKIRTKDEVTKISGIIVTAPIYHAIIAILLVFFIYQCVSLKGFSLVPIIALAFSFIILRDEFKKQSIIKRYIFRGLKNTFEKINRVRK